MTPDEFANLAPGDMLRGSDPEQVFIVTANYTGRVTAVRTVDLTNPPEWNIVAKANYIRMTPPAPCVPPLPPEKT